jgi:hypothetical protein
MERVSIYPHFMGQTEEPFSHYGRSSAPSPLACSGCETSLLTQRTDHS